MTNKRRYPEVSEPFKYSYDTNLDESLIKCKLKDRSSIAVSLSSEELCKLFNSTNITLQGWADEKVAYIREHYDILEEPLQPKLRDVLSNNIGESFEDIIRRRGGRYIREALSNTRMTIAWDEGVTAINPKFLDKLEKDEEHKCVSCKKTLVYRAVNGFCLCCAKRNKEKQEGFRKSGYGVLDVEPKQCECGGTNFHTNTCRFKDDTINETKKRKTKTYTCTYDYVDITNTTQTGVSDPNWTVTYDHNNFLRTLEACVDGNVSGPATLPAEPANRTAEQSDTIQSATSKECSNDEVGLEHRKVGRGTFTLCVACDHKIHYVIGNYYCSSCSPSGLKRC